MQRNQQWIDTMNGYWLVLCWLQCAAMTCPTVFSAFVCCNAAPNPLEQPDPRQWGIQHLDTTHMWNEPSYKQHACAKRRWWLRLHTHTLQTSEISQSKQKCSQKTNACMDSDKDCQSGSSLQIHWVCGAQRCQYRNYIQVTSILETHYKFKKQKSKYTLQNSSQSKTPHSHHFCLFLLIIIKSLHDSSTKAPNPCYV